MQVMDRQHSGRLNKIEHRYEFNKSYHQRQTIVVIMHFVPIIISQLTGQEQEVTNNIMRITINIMRCFVLKYDKE